MTAIKVPPLGESIVEATISRWVKKEGEAVTAGETLVELETDKITVEVPALTSGVLVRRLKAEGDVVNVDEQLAEIDESATAGAAPSAPAAAAAAPQAAAPAAPVAAVPAQPAAGNGAGAADVRASPAAQRLAAESNVDLAAVPGTGRGGVVSKPDVVQALQGAPRPRPPPRRPPPPAPRRRRRPRRPPWPPRRPPPAARARRARDDDAPQAHRREPARLAAADREPHHVQRDRHDAVTALRERVRERVEKEHGVRLSFMPFFVKAA
jgi:2-oxoglutarate dehydrogenase E2 component (dihydrolipoamide succinyltransferase)